MSSLIKKVELNEDETSTYYTENNSYIVATTKDHFVVTHKGIVIDTVEKLNAMDLTKFPSLEGLKIAGALNYARLVKAIREKEEE